MLEVELFEGQLYCSMQNTSARELQTTSVSYTVVAVLQIVW